MTHQVLARKWRPKSFAQMIGQEHILRMLTNALNNQRLHHAYLFTGTRGVGKTTSARILAKCLNCETGITANPCGTCKNCLAIDAGRFLDLIEVDAASKTKVEDTRELLENVHYQPVQGRYKVYLIDEVHMLSGHSFNALLKTLEEPPPYVVFLLATTDPKRLPITVISRCLQFNLKRVSETHIAEYLQHICQNENLAFELPALNLLAKAADGSMRDALSLLDQTIAYCNGNINTKETEQMLGTVAEDSLIRLLQALFEKNGVQILEEIAHLAEMAADFRQALDDILSLLHQMNLYKILPTTVTHATIQTLANTVSAEDLQLYYQIALLGKRDLLLAPSMQQGFEMVFLRMLAFQPNDFQKTVQPSSVQAEVPITNDWSTMLPQLGLTGMTLALAGNCSLVEMTTNTVTLALSKQHEPMLNKKLAIRMEEALTHYFKKPIKLDIKIVAAVETTPAKQHQKEQAAKQTAADAAIQNDDDVKKIMGLFDATLSSVTAT